MAWYSLIYYAALEGVFHKPLPRIHPGVCVGFIPSAMLRDHVSRIVRQIQELAFPMNEIFYFA